MTVGKIGNHRDKITKYGAKKAVDTDGTEFSFDGITDQKYLYVSGSSIISKDAVIASDSITLISPGGVTETYLTISEAITSSVSGDAIQLGPGTYNESFEIPAGVGLYGVSRAVTHIAGASATGTRIVVNNSVAIRCLKITTPTDAVSAIKFTGTGKSRMRSVGFVGTSSVGWDIENSGSGDLFCTHILHKTGSVAGCVKQLGTGKTIIRDFGISSTADVVTDGLVVSDGELIASGVETHNAEVVDFFSAAGGTLHLNDSIADGPTNCLHVTDGSAIVHASAVDFESSTYDLLVDPAASSASVSINCGAMSRERISYPAGSDVYLFFRDQREDDEGFIVYGELAVGRSNDGKESVFGEGDSYVDGMVVLTTDATADTGVDGGNLTDVSTNAASASDSTFSFQGVTDGFAILFGSNLEDTSDLLKHWGLKVKQVTACVEVTPKSFIWEIWNGSAWAEINVLATHSSEFYPYSNEVFVRASSSEHVRFGITDDTIWAKKTIDSKNLYWARVRITTTVTTAPVFQQFKLSSNRSEINADGTHTFHGRSRFRGTLSAAGNIFGEEGTAADVGITIGTGGSPTEWSHNVKNSELNANNDGIHWQFTLPKGIDTSHPLNTRLVFTGTPHGAGAATGSFSMIPVEVAGVPVADPAFGLTPVARTLANTETLTAKVAQTETDSEIDVSGEGKVTSLNFTGYDISDYYEGDIVFFRFVMTDDGDDSVDMAILTAEVSGVRWKHGERL